MLILLFLLICIYWLIDLFGWTDLRFLANARKRSVALVPVPMDRRRAMAAVVGAVLVVQAAAVGSVTAPAVARRAIQRRRPAAQVAATTTRRRQAVRAVQAMAAAEWLEAAAWAEVQAVAVAWVVAEQVLAEEVEVMSVVAAAHRRVAAAAVQVATTWPSLGCLVHLLRKRLHPSLRIGATLK